MKLKRTRKQLINDTSWSDEQLLHRGHCILDFICKRNLNDKSSISKPEADYLGQIYVSVNASFDTPVDENLMCKALAIADYHDKIVKLVPDEDCKFQCDGWSYHIVLSKCKLTEKLSWLSYKEYLSKCKFYQGEPENPYSVEENYKRCLWLWESFLAEKSFTISKATADEEILEFIKAEAGTWRPYDKDEICNYYIDYNKQKTTIEENSKNITDTIMEKVARICWNTHDWKRPSGREGKAQAKYQFVQKLGFGHEEWLLDDSKILPDGYHYAFLQPVNTKERKHQGNTYDIHLFTFNNIFRKKEYVGCLHNVECISEEEAKAVYRYYKKEGWIKEMKDDIRFAGGTVADIDSTGLMFNIRFKFSDADIKYSNRPIISDEDPNTRGMYYKLMDKKGEFIFEKDEEGNIKSLDTSSIVVVTSQGEILIDPLHKKIQNALMEILKDEYVQLYCEKGDPGSGQRIDLRGIYKNSADWHYYEIKTSSAKESIREALGQILEYNHYPSKSKAAKLYIVGPMAPDEKDRQYLKKLRDTYKMPLWYRWYSFENNTLSEEI